MTRPPVPEHLDPSAYLQLAVFVLAWASVFASFVIGYRAYIKHGDVIARAEQIVDDHEDIETWVADWCPTTTDARRLARQENPDVR